MKILLTGANAFVARALGPTLLKSGNVVTACIRPAAQPAEWIVSAGGAVTVIEADLGDETAVRALPRGQDVIIHAAGRLEDPATPPEAFLRDNTESTRTLLDFARTDGAQRFIHFSSLSVHGDISVAMVDETTPVANPTPYGESKRLAEECLSAQSGIPSVSLRLPGIVGPHAHENWLARCRAALRHGEPVRISNPDFAFNNVIHVQDLADFVARLCTTDWSGQHAFPVAAGTPMTVADMLGAMKRALSSDSEINIAEGGRAPFSISSGYAERAFGYAPTAVEDIIRRFSAEP